MTTSATITIFDQTLELDERVRDAVNAEIPGACVTTAQILADAAREGVEVFCRARGIELDRT